MNQENMINALQTSKLGKQIKQLTPLEYTPNLQNNFKEDGKEVTKQMNQELTKALEILSDNSGLGRK